MSSSHVADGQDILAELAARGITVTLDAECRPRVGPRALVDQDTMALLSAHREAVMAALAAAEEISWHVPCSVCGSRGECRQRIPQPDGGWICQEALDAGLVRGRHETEPDPVRRGNAVQVVPVEDRGRRSWHVRWRVVDLEGQPLGLGLFASRRSAVEWVERKEVARQMGSREVRANE